VAKLAVIGGEDKRGRAESEEALNRRAAKSAAKPVTERVIECVTKRGVTLAAALLAARRLRAS